MSTYCIDYLLRIHLLSGRALGDSFVQEETLVANLQSSVSYLREAGVTGLIEPLCLQAKPGYFLNNFQTGEIMDNVNTNIKKKKKKIKFSFVF